MGPFKVENLGKKTHPGWKKLAIWACRTLPVYATIIAGLKDTMINPDTKVWIITGLSLIVATISGLSEFTTNESK